MDKRHPEDEPLSEEPHANAESTDMPIELIPKLVLGYRPLVRESPDLHVDLSIGIVLGRSNSFHRKYRESGLGMIGAVCETTDDALTSLLGMPVSLDLVSPHVIFVAGKRGSGKSYTLGIIAEELARAMERKEIEVAAVVIDTVDVFRQAVEPNTDQGDLLQRWGLEAKGFPIAVYIPRRTYNGLPEDVRKKARLFPLAISPCELSASDWGYVLEKGGQFSTTMENLMGDMIDSLKRGFTDESGERIGHNRDYSIEQMIAVIEINPSITELYQMSTRTAMIQRLRRAQRLGIFHPGGASAQDLAVAGQITIIDVAPLGSDAETVLAILTNILCRQVLTYRMAWTDDGASAREELPPTWLIIDEAHTLVPRSGNTPAKSAIVGYAKLGRRFGCSLVLCTQQPSAVSDDAISQADIILSHALSLDSDIRALQQRAPAVLPEAFRDKMFISSLPRGVAIALDQTTDNKRGFLVQIRPRLSQHGGTDRLSSMFEAARIMPTDDLLGVEDIEEGPELGPAEELGVSDVPSTTEDDASHDSVPEATGSSVKLSREDWEQMEERMRDYVSDLFERERQPVTITDESSPAVVEALPEDPEPHAEAPIELPEAATPEDALRGIDLRVKQFGKLSQSLLSKAVARKALYSRSSHTFLFSPSPKQREVVIVERTKVQPDEIVRQVLGRLMASGMVAVGVTYEDGFTFIHLQKQDTKAVVTLARSGSSISVGVVIAGMDSKTVSTLAHTSKLP